MTALPTRIRTHIRDYITSPTSPFSLKSTALKSTLGYPLSLDPEWAMLWKTLQVYYPDQATFVPSIATMLITWCDAFTTWLEAEENEGDVEKILDGVSGREKVEIVLEILPSSPKTTRPTTVYRANNSLFVVYIPKAEPVYASTILAGFSTDLLSLFTASPLMLPSSTNTATAEDPEAWADLALDTPDPAFPRKHTALDIGDDALPEISTIPRPEELLKKAPYWLVVRQEGRMKVVIQSSHATSLGCLETYLKRWCRGEVGRVNRPPVVEIKLQESAFGLGLLNDTLTLEAIRGREVSAMMVLVFVENVLGYTPIPANGSAGSVWEFKRMKGFK